MRNLYALLCIAVLMTACKDDHDHDHDNDGCGCAHGHDHTAPNGGELVELGKHEAHAEFKLDHKAGTLTVWTYDDKVARKDADHAPTLRVKHKGETVSLKAEGSGNQWVFTHDVFKSEPEKARVRLSIGGSSFTTDWTHDHDHDHGHGDHDGHDHDHDHGDHDHKKDG